MGWVIIGFKRREVSLLAAILELADKWQTMSANMCLAAIRLARAATGQRAAKTRRADQLALATALALTTIVSGCVGGPTGSMKSAATEAALSGTVPVEQTVSAIEPVQAVALPPAAGQLQSPAEPNQVPVNPAATTTASAYVAPQTAVLGGSENEQLLAGDTIQPLSESQLAPVPQPSTGSGPIMLAALPADNEQTTPGTLPQTAPDKQQVIYPDQQTAPQLASLTTGVGFALGSESSEVVDPLEAAAQLRVPELYARVQHGQCEGGFGPKPKKISAKRITPGDPYYIEIRMRRTPLLPVGHTYVAYGSLDANGNILDEKLIMLAPVGGYAGAALASGVPMPGILNPHPDDCRIRPETAYRVSLNAQRYEKLLLEVEKVRSETPKYLLFSYNCNHFMTRMAGAVGIRPPKNIYVPALEYIYAMIEENEGRKIARR
jgi:hypothetical protein